MANNSNKAKRLTGINPMAYMGVEPLAPVDFVTDDRDPTTSDYSNFNIGQLWLNTSSYDVFMLVNKGLGVATWNMLSGGTGDLVSLTGNSGGAVMADPSHNINVVGDGTTIDIVGNPGTYTLTASVISGVYPENFPVPNGTTPVVPSGAGAVSLTSTLGSVTITGGLNTINFDVTGGAAVTNYPVPNGTTPVVPSGAGAVTLTSTDNSITITGGLNTIDFSSGGGALYTVQTTDATPTALATIAVTADSAATLFVELTAADSVYGQSLHCNATGGGQYPSAGALSLIGVPIVNILTDFATATVDIVASGNNLVIQVTGEGATTINWSARVRVVTV